MRKVFYSLAGIAFAGTLMSCSGGMKVAKMEVSPSLGAAENVTVDVPVDKGYYVLFDGTSLKGWRGYAKSYMPDCWKIEDGCLKFSRSNGREGGDVIFAHKFRNFELEMEWKIAKGGNSGIFYLAQEFYTIGNDGKMNVEPIFISAPEYQVLDNENHPDAKLGKDNNRKAASLYDMIPAKPQNAKPYGEWNKAKIVVKDGVVSHYQNDVKVLEYRLWTKEWTDLLQESKFSEKAWPQAFIILNDCGGVLHSGYIGLQDHGDDVWYRNIRVKVLD